MAKRILIFLCLVLAGCTETGFRPEWTKEKSPEIFTARFETTKGDFDIEVVRKRSPLAADRFYQLVCHKYYDNAIFYRVVPGFVAQFGNTDSSLMNQWRSVKVPDEPVVYSNKKGTVSFARYGAGTRDLELFVNLADNTMLDTLDFEGVRGFPAIGKVVKGMETVEALYSEYGEKTMSDGNLYLDRAAFYRSFPKLDLIRKAYLLERQ